ncbi:MAG TPA: carbohydrate ABC transporter permease [Streptosporangiaceae bacterium]|jgi:ABC-type glycerol-3-phosphate transport system permease component|nr:carbohydrate ABC transporter permease [Streptosporangiaceae bacterium]
MIRLRARARRTIRITAITIIGLILAFPLIYLVLGSVMTSAQLTSFPPQFIPTSIHLGNYSLAWDYMRGRSVLNSVIFTVATVGLQWALCISAGFALAKLRFRSSNKVTALLGVSLFVPIITTLVPTFIVTDKFHLVNTYPGLILPIVAQTGFGTLLFRQYITGLPTELVDAARVDGTSWLGILRRVIIPLATPATGAYVAISVLTAWNMYLWPLVVATTPNVQVMTETLAPLASSEYGSIPENVGFAATALTTLPMVVAFLLAQRAFVRGLSGSGVE